MNFFKNLFRWFLADEEDRQRILQNKRQKTVQQQHHNPVETFGEVEVDDVDYHECEEYEEFDEFFD
jgi:hypothetical protein